MTDTILGYDAKTIDMIATFADNHDLPPVMLLASGLQESNLDVNESTGDHGVSFGCFQVYTSLWGGPPSRWLGYPGLANSMRLMGENVFSGGQSRWHWAFTKEGGWARWVTDAVNMMFTVGPEMQGSDPWTVEEAHTNVSRANALYALYLKGQQAPSPPPPDDRLEVAIAGLTLARQGLEDQRRRIGEIIDAQQEGISAVLARLK